MKNRIFVSLIVGTIVTSIVLGATCVGFALDAKKKTGMLENMYERSFYSLCDSVNNLETDLSKLKVAVSDYESLPLMQSVYSHAATASESYAGLPIDSENETDCIKFFNQVSDWAASYAKSLSSTKSNGYKKQAGQLY